MKTKPYILLTFLFAGSLTLAACEQSGTTEKTGITTTEDMVEGADGGLDSLNAEADTSATITSDTLSLQ
ncbi:hypothetical protein [Nibribacter koreensis]|uniref:Entericidin n=1 Tax=Nibribacter koreensis TaxID=1084519 RepID=A0ABP8FAI7_9BACT